MQSYKYNSKEFVEMHGFDTYDYSARMMYPAVGGRFMTIDPMAEKYYSISPYAYCHNNPINRIDPDGMDDWEVNQDGYLKKVPDTESEIDKIYVVNNELKRTEHEPFKLDKGILDEMQTILDFNNPTEPNANKIEIENDDNAGDFFEFLSDNTSVEFSLTNTSETNYLNTSHEKGRESGFRRSYNKGFIDGTIEKHSHNHPSNRSTPSIEKDLVFKDQLTNSTNNKNIIFNIYVKKPINNEHYFQY